MQEQSVQRSLGTFLRLISAAAGLLLFTQVSRIGVVDWQAPYLLALASIAVLYAGISWMYSGDELASQSYWLTGIAALVLASAMSGQVNASIAWGLGGLLSGGGLFLYSVPGRWLAILPALGLLQMSGLPLTQTWNGAGLFGAIGWLGSVFLGLGLALLLAGHYLRWSLKKQAKPDAERWVVVIYIWGLASIAGSQAVLALSENVMAGSLLTPLSLATVAPGLAACGVAAIIDLDKKKGYCSIR